MSTETGSTTLRPEEVYRMLDDFQSLEERVSMLASRRPCPWLSAVWTVEEEGGRDGGREGEMDNLV